MSQDYKPAGYSSVSPYLVVSDAKVVVDFLVAALDAKPLRNIEDDDGATIHTEVKVDDTVIMLGEAGEGWASIPCHVHVYVADVDTTFERAIEAGAVRIQDPHRREDDPDKRGGVLGPGGNTWWFSTQMV